MEESDHDYETGITALSEITAEGREILERRLSSEELRFAVSSLPLPTLRKLYNQKGLEELARYLESLALSRTREEQITRISERQQGPDWVRVCMERDLDESSRYSG